MVSKTPVIATTDSNIPVAGSGQIQDVDGALGDLTTSGSTVGDNTIIARDQAIIAALNVQQ